MKFQSKKAISVMQYMLFLIEVIKKVWGVHFKGIIDENIGKYETASQVRLEICDNSETANLC